MQLLDVACSVASLDSDRPLVGILLPRAREFVASALGVLAAGRAYVAIDPAQPATRISAIIRDADVAATITNEDMKTLLPPECPILLSGHLRGVSDALSCGTFSAPRYSLESHDLAYVMYTSGSTGEPKGVAVGHRSLQILMRTLDRDLSEPDQVWMAASSFAFDSSIVEVLWPVSRGHYLCLGPNDAVGLLDSQIATGTSQGRRITHMQGTPSMARLLASDPATLSGLQQLEKLLLGGEHFPLDLVPLLTANEHSQPRLINVYGPTEATVWVSRSVVTPDTTGPVSIGTPIPGTGDIAKSCGWGRGVRRRPLTRRCSFRLGFRL